MDIEAKGMLSWNPRKERVTRKRILLTVQF